MSAPGLARRSSALRSLCAVLLMASLAALAGCSNGRGSVATAEEAEGEGFLVGGAASGLVGTGLTLQINGASDLPISANGPFSFVGPLANGASYNVTILSQPADPAQTCTVSNGNGQVAGADIASIAIVCVTGSTEFTVGGQVSGLTGAGLILRSNGAEDLPIAADGEFIFPTAIATGAAYDITVAAQPAGPAQTCTVENGAGVMGSTDITAVRVICSTSAFTVGGAVAGLSSLGLRLRNGDEVIAIGADGPFSFRNAVASGAGYAVSVEAQAQGQNCVVQNGAGVIQSADITDVAVTCASNVYTIGGSISGLAPGARVALRMSSGGESVTHTASRNGVFAFERSLASGAGYVVDVATQPATPAQECSVASASGIVNAANVTSIAVTCTTRSFTVGGMVEGLQGSGLVLQLNGANDLSVAANGSFIFDAPLQSGVRYDVTVAAQPATPPQTCTVQQGSGTLGGANVRNVRVTCALNTYPVGGTVTGLTPPGRVVLQNNGGDPVEVAADGAFTFPTQVATGGSYNVSVGTQPAGQFCTVANGTGTIAAAAVGNIAVTCTPTYAVNVTVTGLLGSGLVVRNGEEDLSIGSDGVFTFTTRLRSGAQYNVTVVGQPLNPSQTCTVTGGAGSIAGDVNIAVSCTTNTFTIGGNVSGQLFQGLELQLNGAENLPIAPGTGTFAFTTLVPSSQPYLVTVTREPIGGWPFFPRQQCTVTGGSGVVGAENVTTVAVTCQ